MVRATILVALFFAFKTCLKTIIQLDVGKNNYSGNNSIFQDKTLGIDSVLVK